MTAEARRRRSAGAIVGIVVGSIVGLAVAIAAIIGLGYLFFLLMQLIFVSIGHAIADAFKQAFS